jgi:predicted glycosyltransferase
MLLPDESTDPRQMGNAIRALPNRRRPSKVHIPGLLDGLSVINGLVQQYIQSARREPGTARLSIARSGS